MGIMQDFYHKLYGASGPYKPPLTAQARAQWSIVEPSARSLGTCAQLRGPVGSGFGGEVYKVEGILSLSLKGI